MRRNASVLVLWVIGILLGGTLAAAAETRGGTVRAQMELNQNFYYVGDPLSVRVVISNTGSAEVSNPIKGDLFTAFSVSDAAGKRLEPGSKAEAQEPARPPKLAPNALYGGVVDLAKMYPQLRSTGRFTIKWSANGVAADDISVTIITKMDPKKDYAARVETEQGTFVIDLFKKTAPIAVKAFADLANAGFYDGLLIHEAIGNQLIGGGDPTGTGRGQAPLRYPAELGAVPIVVGSVLMKPAGLAPPANSSQFIVALQPQSAWIGQFTVVGQVVEGLEVVRKLSNLPTADPPSHKPLKDVHTLRVAIEEKASVPAPAAPAPSKP